MSIQEAKVMRDVTESLRSSVNSERMPLLQSVVPMPAQQEKPADKGLGAKTITYFGSVVLSVNNMSGPGMLAIPIVFQQAGLLLPCILLVLLAILSGFSATLLCESMVLIPGNNRFQKRYEFSTIVEHFYGHRAYQICQLAYSMSLTSLNIASIIVTAQVMDQFLIRIFGASFCLRIHDMTFQRTENLVTPFEGYGLVITLGYMVVVAMCMPIGFLNLDEGIYAQYVSFGACVVFSTEFLVQYFMNNLKTERVPFVGSNLSQLVGALLFNFTFVVTIPSWANEKQEHVSVNKVIWYSAAAVCVMYFVLGYIAAIAYQTVASNVLTTFASGGHLATEISAYLFSLGVIGLGIPLFSIMVRYNLYVGKVFGRGLSAFFGVVLPWLVSWTLYQGNGFSLFISYSSLLINSAINFMLPMFIYVRAREQYATSLPEMPKSTDITRTRRSLTIVEAVTPDAIAPLSAQTAASLNASIGGISGRQRGNSVFSDGGSAPPNIYSSINDAKANLTSAGAGSAIGERRRTATSSIYTAGGSRRALEPLQDRTNNIDTVVNALPKFLRPLRRARLFAYSLLVFCFTLTVVALVYQIESQIRG